MVELTIDDIKAELHNGARVILQLRHAERPKMDPDDPSFGDQLKLTYEGVRTAKELGRRLREFKEDVSFYASPLMRTRITAKAIAEGMGLEGAEIPVDDLLGNGSFYYDDPAEVLDVFKPKNFFPACFEYFRTARQRGFKELYAASDAYEKWLLAHARTRLFIVATHDLYIAAFLYAYKAVEEFTCDNWVRFLDGGAIIIYPDGSRKYALVRSNLSTGICGVHRPKLSAVIFDFGGVFTKTTMPERVRKSVEDTGISWEYLADGFARYRKLMDGGFITAEEMYDNIWADAGIDPSPAIRAKIIEEDFASYLSEARNEQTLRFMRELKERGYRLGILTNMPPQFAPKFRAAYHDFIALVDAVVISGEERMFKPQPRIYARMEAAMGLPGNELCFIDDVATNCQAAREAGWQAIQFESNRQVEDDFNYLAAESKR